MNEIVTGIGLASAAGTGLVFVESGIAKLRHRDLVPGVIANYRLLPQALVAPVAALLPPFELALGLGLVASALTGGALRVLAVAAALVLLAFAGGMAINLRRGRRHIDCGCGRSQLRQPISRALVARNIVLATLVSIHVVPGEAPASAVIALSVVAGLSLFLIYQLFNALAALAASSLATGRR